MCLWKVPVWCLPLMHALLSLPGHSRTDYFAERTPHEFPSSAHTTFVRYHWMQSFTSKTPCTTSFSSSWSHILMRVTVLPSFTSTERLYQNPTFFMLKNFFLTFSLNVFILCQKKLLLSQHCPLVYTDVLLLAAFSLFVTIYPERAICSWQKSVSQIIDMLRGRDLQR